MKLSIVTINFNNAEGLKKTIKSIVEQTCQKYEYIIIDGGSSDASKEIIISYQEKISYWCSEQDAGIYSAMNKGISKATGEYLLFLNSGDCLYDSTVLEDVMQSLSGESIIYGDLYFMDNADRGEVFVYPDVLSIDYFLERSLGHPASFIKKNVFQDSLYSESFKIVSDWEFFLKKIVLEAVSYKHIGRIISVFDTSGVSSQSLELCNEEREQVLQHFFPGMLLGSLRSAVYMKQQPLYQLFCELSATSRFQYRIKPVIAFLLRLNQLFSIKKKRRG